VIKKNIFMIFPMVCLIWIPQIMAETVSFVGTLYPQQDVDVSAEIVGKVDNILVDVGDRVRKGQILLKLDDHRENLELQIKIGQLNEILAKLGVTVETAESFDVYGIPLVITAQQDFIEKERILKRSRLLHERGAISQEQLDKDETACEKSRANLQAALDEIRGYKAIIKQLKSGIQLFVKDLEDTTVTSPINGYVQERYVDVGEYLSKEGTKVLRVLHTDVLKLKGNIPSRYVASLRKGLPATFTVDGIPDKVFSGRLDRIAPGIDVKTRTISVEIKVNNRDQKLKPGYFIKAKIDLGASREPVKNIMKKERQK